MDERWLLREDVLSRRQLHHHLPGSWAAGLRLLPAPESGRKSARRARFDGRYRRDQGYADRLPRSRFAVSLPRSIDPWSERLQLIPVRFSGHSLAMKRRSLECRWEIDFIYFLGLRLIE